MALLTAQGTILTPGSNGDVSITGLGFEPKLVMFVRGGSGNDVNFCLGAATSSGQWVISHFDDHNKSSGAVPNRYGSTTSCLAVINASGTGLNSEGNLKSIDSDGFTVEFTTTALGFGYTWIAFGGTSLDVDVGSITVPNTDATDFSAAGLPFEPKAIQVATPWSGTYGSTITNYFTTLGFSTGVSNQGSVQSGSRTGVTSNAFRYMSNTKILKRGITSGGSIDAEVSFKQFNSDGFTLTADFAPGASQLLPYIAWGGDISVDLTSVIQPTTNTTQNVTGLGFQPSFSFAYSSQATAAGTDQASTLVNSNISFGFSDGTNSIAVEKRAEDGVTTTNTFSNQFTGIYTGGNSLTVRTGQATYANAADGFDLTWTNNDGAQRELLVLSIGEVGSTLEIALDHLPSSLVMYAPTVLKDKLINLETISSTESVYSPDILKSKIINLEGIASTESVSPPTVTKDKLITLETSNSTLSVYNPSVTKDKLITLETINSTVVTYPPLILQDKIITLDYFQNYGLVYHITVTGGEIPVGPEFPSARIQIQWQDIYRL